jgi:hypothetical protein
MKMSKNLAIIIGCALAIVHLCTSAQQEREIFKGRNITEEADLKIAGILGPVTSGKTQVCETGQICEIRITAISIDEETRECFLNLKDFLIISGKPKNNTITWILDNDNTGRSVSMTREGDGSGVNITHPSTAQFDQPKMQDAKKFTVRRIKSGDPTNVGGGRPDYPFSLIAYDIYLEFTASNKSRKVCKYDPLIANLGS